MKIKRATWILSIAALTAVAGFALQAGTRSQSTGVPDKVQRRVEIKIDNFSFGPMTLTVSTGTTVTWTNNDNDPHTVVSADKTTFKSPALDTGEKYSYTFTKPGKYAYFCSVHPKMTAEVVVHSED